MAVVENATTTVVIQHDGGTMLTYMTTFVQAVAKRFFQLLL